MFRNSDCLSSLTTEQQHSLWAVATRQVVRSGETLIEEGEDSDAMFFVESGRFSVSVGDKQNIAEIGAGHTIGEVGFLSGTPRTASITASRDSIVLKLGRTEFDALCETIPNLLHAISQSLASKLVASNETMLSREHVAPRTIVLCAAGRSRISEEFIGRLAAAFGRNKTCLVLSQDVVEEQCAGCELISDTVTSWLNQQEIDYDHVLYLADREPDDWTAICFRQSEAVLLVADTELSGAEDRQLNPVEIHGRGHHPHLATWMVLVHPRERAFTGTRAWLNDRSCVLHLHLAVDDDRHYARLVRFYEGEATGLVASGGGAYSAAHIGAQRALQESGYTFDMVGGSSGGAAMAFAWPIGYSADQMSEGVEEAMVTSGSLKKFTFPKYSIVNHRYFDKQVRSHYGGWRLEDFWIKFFAVSSNLSTGKLHVHQEGDSFFTIRASGSIPGILPPMVTESGEVLVDGGVIDNVPVQTMKELKSGPNLIICFEEKRETRTQSKYEEIPGTFGTFLEFTRLKSPSKDFYMPGIGSVLIQSMLLDNNSLAEATDQDLVLRMSLPKDIKLNDWHRQREISEIGYQLTRQWLLDHADHPVLVKIKNASVAGHQASSGT